jgi:L-galactose dehydrogenase
MEYSNLGRTGLRVSKLGFGAAPLGNEFGTMDVAEGARTVDCALDLGINFFDVAPYYGRGLAEERLGEALAGRRHKAVLATKCGRYDIDAFDFSADRIRRSVEESLRRLRTDYIDLYQAHDVEFVSERQIVDEAIPTMRELQREGKVRFIGITGLQLKVLRRIAEAIPVDTILSYARYNLLIHDLHEYLASLVHETGVGLINASPLLLGILSETGPQPWHPASDEIKRSGAELVEMYRRARERIEDAGLRYAVANPLVSTTLSGMSTEAQVRQNVRAVESNATPPFLGTGEFKIWRSGRPENQD